MLGFIAFTAAALSIAGILYLIANAVRILLIERTIELEHRPPDPRRNGQQTHKPIGKQTKAR